MPAERCTEIGTAETYPGDFVEYRLCFHNLRELGSGTFGTVYEGTRGGHRYAIKKYTYSSEPLHHTTVRELRAMRTVDSPYVLPLLGVVIENYQIYAVFPFYPDDLGRLLARAPLTLCDCQRIFAHALRGAQALHAHGFVHRDLKPANVLVRRDSAGYAACVCDFGMTKEAGARMTPGAVTLWYRAPELLQGCGNYGATADVWSLGCVLFEMLRGQPLFAGESEAEQLRLISARCGPLEGFPGPEEGELGVGALLAGISADAADLIDRMLAVEPAKRLSVEECLSHAFLAGVQNE